MVDVLQFGVGLIPLVSFYVVKRASSFTVKLKAVLAGIGGIFLYLLWYSPIVLVGFGGLSLQTVQLASVLREIFVSRIDNSIAGLAWTGLLAVNLVIGATGTRIPRLYDTRKALAILFWLATAFVVWEAFNLVGMTALYGLLIPVSTTLLAWSEEILDEIF